jgi:hypothetical protein
VSLGTFIFCEIKTLPMHSAPSNWEIAYLLLHITFGANIFLHGLMRLLEGHAGFLAYITKQMQGAPVPSWFLPPFYFSAMMLFYTH